MDHETSYSYPNTDLRRPHLSSSAFSNYAVGFPGLWLPVGPGTLEDHLMTCQRSTPLFLHDTTGSPTPSTTRRPRQRPRLVLRHCGTYAHNHVERLGHRNPIITNAKNSSPTPQTPLFGTTPTAPRRAARCRLPTATPQFWCSSLPPRHTGC